MNADFPDKSPKALLSFSASADCESDVIDLMSARERRIENADDSRGQCADGICVLSWRPRRPRNDAA